MLWCQCCDVVTVLMWWWCDDVLIMCLHPLFQCASSGLAKMRNRDGLIPLCVPRPHTVSLLILCPLTPEKPGGQTAKPSLPSCFWDFSKVFLPLCHQQQKDDNEAGRQTFPERTNCCCSWLFPFSLAVSWEFQTWKAGCFDKCLIIPSSLPVCSSTEPNPK